MNNILYFWSLRVRLDTAENWKLKLKTEKHCSKIIFKCVNSTVGLIFNIFFWIKWLWVSWTVYKQYMNSKTSIHASTTEAFLPNTQQMKMGAYLPRGNLQISNWRLAWPFDDSFIGFPITPRKITQNKLFHQVEYILQNNLQKPW